MALLTPKLNQVLAIDATTDYTFTFDVPSGGDNVEGNTLYVEFPEIEGTPSHTESFSATSHRYENTLPANSLENGYQYSAYVITRGASSQSSPSNSITFYAYPTPSFVLGNITTTQPQPVTTSNFAPSIFYSQEPSGEDDITDPLQDYTISLYDMSQNLLATSGVIETNSTDVPYGASYPFVGLENGKHYLVRATGHTKSGAEVSTVYGEIEVGYEAPEGVEFVVENECYEGRIHYHLDMNSLILLSAYDTIRIKRKRDDGYEWVVLQEVSVKNEGGDDWEYPEQTNRTIVLTQAFAGTQIGNTWHLDVGAVWSVNGYDNLAASETQYSYAWVPVVNGVEGNYYNVSIYSHFNGVFLCDDEVIYKFPVGVSYGASSQVQDVGLFAPLNRKYPVYISNSKSNYQVGSFNGLIIGAYMNTHVLDRKEMVGEKNRLLAFLTNKRGKVLKDFNGNTWLIFVLDNPSISYKDVWGNGLMSIGFNYSEIGDANNVVDLREAFLL